MEIEEIDDAPAEDVAGLAVVLVGCGNEDVRIEDVDEHIAANGLEPICILLEEEIAGNDDTLEPGNWL